MSLVVDTDGIFVDGSRGFGSGKEAVEDFHTSAYFVVEEFESFLLTSLFLNVERTEVEPEPGGDAQEGQSGFNKINWYLTCPESGTCGRRC